MRDGRTSGGSIPLAPCGGRRFWAAARARLGPAALTVAAILIVACSGSPSGESPGSVSASPSATESTSGPAMRLVVLGDSIALGETCAGCSTYPEQLATAMGDALNVEVETENLAVPGAEVADLLDLVRTDSTVQDSITEADAILVTIGLNDLAFGRLDDPCNVAPNFPRVRWSSITHSCVDEATDEYQRDLNGVLDEIDGLRAGQPTMLRVTTVYNSVIGDLVDPTWNSPAAIEPSMYAVQRMAEAQCRVAEAHDGLCADTYHALNGEDGSESAQPFLNPADATHLAQPGEDAFAAALITLGFSPLQR